MNQVFFDLETHKLLEEVPGRNPAALLLACAATYSTSRGNSAVCWEGQTRALLEELARGQGNRLQYS